ncbi:MAG: malto-oligosyltrehalose trehalohydrolase [bacterium]
MLRTGAKKAKRSPFPNQDRSFRRLPVGAEVMPGRKGGVHFRVWAPRCRQVSVVVESDTGAGGKHREYPMEPEEGGYCSRQVSQARPGTLYRYRLDERLFPDPASRFQPSGPEGPSQVIDPSAFRWTDADWSGVRLEGQVICEVHIGTFTSKGTWKAAARRLSELKQVGITLVELMPVAEFSGRFGWGYDGVDLFAPFHEYGAPDDFRSFVDQAHALGMGVVLDVVYNHFGPVGNFWSEFSLDYFTDRYETEWGYAINFDGGNSGPVRELFVANAGYWIEEYHLDGLRLDATQSLHDQSPEHILAALTRKAREKGKGRSLLITAENEPQNSRLLAPPDEGGFGIDAVWNDDFHHSARVALSGRKEAYHTDYLGSAQEFVSAAKWGYLYQGQFYSWQNKCRGTPVLEIRAPRFISYLENHDQIANSLRGERLHRLAHPGKYRALTALLLLMPGTPLLFQGQDFGASSPFCYFADQRGDLARAVARGRTEFLLQFASLRDPEAQALLPDPSHPGTFERCRIDHAERKSHAESSNLHRDLLRMRREDAVFREQRTDWMQGAVLGPDAFLLRFLGGDRGDRLIVVNLGADRTLLPIPEPLLAPPKDSHWELLWSSEAVAYGGGGTPPMETEGRWTVPGHATLVFAPKKVVRLEYA